MSAGVIDWSENDRLFDKTLLRAMAISAAIHLLFFITVAVAGHFNKKPKFDENAMRVRLMAAPAGPKKKGPPAKPKTLPPPKKPKPKQIAKPELKPEKEEKPIAEKKEPEKKPPEKKPEPEKDPEPPETMPDNKLEEIEIARAMIHKQGDDTDPGGSFDEADWDNAIAGLEGDIMLKNYQAGAGEALGRAWRVPATVPTHIDLEVRVLIIADQDGNILDYQIVGYSNNPELDRSVERLMERAEKVPPPPFDVLGGQIIIPLRFVPGEE
jgi:protein TonB